jgi:hypothetical protein
VVSSSALSTQAGHTAVQGKWKKSHTQNLFPRCDSRRISRASTGSRNLSQPMIFSCSIPALSLLLCGVHETCHTLLFYLRSALSAKFGAPEMPIETRYWSCDAHTGLVGTGSDDGSDAHFRTSLTHSRLPRNSEYPTIVFHKVFGFPTKTEQKSRVDKVIIITIISRMARLPDSLSAFHPMKHPPHIPTLIPVFTAVFITIGSFSHRLFWSLFGTILTARPAEIQPTH